MAKISLLPQAAPYDGSETLPIVQGGRTRRSSLIALALAMVPFLQNYYKGDKGDPGGSPMSVGRFADVGQLNIPLGTDLIVTSGATRGVLIEDTALTDAGVAAHPLACVKTKNGRYFRRDPRDLWGEQFGMRPVEDKSFDSAPGLDAAWRYVAFCSRTADPFPTVRAGPMLHIGIGNFYLASRVNSKVSCTTIGSGRGHVGGIGATRFSIEDGGGISFERANTLNFGTTASTYGADGQCTIGIQFRYVGSQASREGGRNAQFGVVAKCRSEFVDCSFLLFPGPGLFVLASSGEGGVREGEASCGLVSKCYFDSNWAGLVLEGADTNVWDISNNTFAGNYWGCHATNSFLTTNWRNNHYKYNGKLVHYNGARWQPMPGYDAQWGSVAPGTNPLVWGFAEYGGPSPSNEPFFEIPTWQNGGTYKTGASIYCANQNLRATFVGEYCEGGSARPVIQFPAIILGGQITNIARESGGTAVQIAGEQGFMEIDQLHVGKIGAYGTDIGADYLGVSGPDTPFPLVLRARAKDYVFSIGQGDVSVSVLFTGDTTTQTFGRDAPQKYAVVFPYGMVVGARRWNVGRPSSGYAASGELFFDQDNGNRVGWKCVGSGTIGSTAVFKEFSTVA